MTDPVATRSVVTVGILRPGSLLLHPIRVSNHQPVRRAVPMYDMYPDWGPANHQPENPHSHEAVQASLDLRDNGAERPDDN
jgi:hypothetical protein